MFRASCEDISADAYFCQVYNPQNLPARLNPMRQGRVQVCRRERTWPVLVCALVGGWEDNVGTRWEEAPEREAREGVGSYVGSDNLI
jgi:hypothetical protein